MQREIEKANTAIFYVNEVYKLIHKSENYSKQIQYLKKNLDKQQIALIDKFASRYIEGFDHNDINEFISKNQSLNNKLVNKILIIMNKRITNDQLLDEQINMNQVKRVFLKYYINTKKLGDKTYKNKANQTI